MHSPRAEEDKWGRLRLHARHFHNKGIILLLDASAAHQMIVSLSVNRDEQMMEIQGINEGVEQEASKQTG